MTLPASGNIAMKAYATGSNAESIEYEVTGAVSGTGYSLLDAQADSVPEVGSPTNVRFSDFYGHSQGLGETYGLESDGREGWLGPQTDGGYYDLGGADPIYSSVYETEDIIIYKDNTGTAFNPGAGDNVDVKVYRRDKDSTASWGTAVHTEPCYASLAEQAYTCDFANYDYQFEILAGSCGG